MRMSDWSSDVCSSDLALFATQQTRRETGTIKHHLRLKNRKILGCRRRSHLYIFKMAQWRFSYCRSLLILAASVVRLYPASGTRYGYSNQHSSHILIPEIGRASCRTRVCQYV